MKLYALMQENAEDLSKLLVSLLAVSLTDKVLTSASDAGEWQDAGGGQGICCLSQLCRSLTLYEG